MSVTPPNSTVDAVKQRLVTVEKSDKIAVLTHLIKENNWYQVLVFSRTKHGANKLVKKLLAQDVEAAAIHGNKSQATRTRVLAEFKQGKVRVLVATDIAARGIDIDQLPHVVNFDLPNVPEDYVHRIGRTGRAGATGEAVSLVSHDEFKQLQDIERLIRKNIPREVIDGFEPLNNVPESTGELKARKPKKPKKPKSVAREGQGRNNRAVAGGDDDAGRRRSRRQQGKKKVSRTASSGSGGANKRRSQSGGAGNADGKRRQSNRRTAGVVS